jgi:hypothetical protein
LYTYCYNSPLLVIDADGLWGVYVQGSAHFTVYRGIRLSVNLGFDSEGNIGVVGTIERENGLGAGATIGFAYDQANLCDTSLDRETLNVGLLKGSFGVSRNPETWETLGFSGGYGKIGVGPDLGITISEPVATGSIYINLFRYPYFYIRGAASRE